MDRKNIPHEDRPDQDSREQSPDLATDLIDWMVGVDRVVGLGLDGNEEVLGRTMMFLKLSRRSAR